MRDDNEKRKQRIEAIQILLIVTALVAYLWVKG